MSWAQHLILLPVLLPLICGAVLVLVSEQRHGLKFVLNLASVLLQFLVAVALLRLSDGGHWEQGIGVYLAANWAAPFGIALVVDRLAALLLVLTGLIAACALVYTLRGWSRIGVHFHSLFQFLLMGLNGAFLTHDLFNLFVFFEVMLASSYGLLLHGYNTTRIKAGLQFVAVNLIASLLFLIGIALVYAATGTLNMADLAARVPQLAGEPLLLLKVGAGVLAVAFLTKGAMWPLCFWLPTAYAAASPPIGALFVLMTKVGTYVILRLWLLIFSATAGATSGFGGALLLWGGLVTMAYGAMGLLASKAQGRLAGYAALTSSGTLLAAIGLGEPVLMASLLFYLLSSTLGLAAFMLLVELIERCRNPVEALLAVTRQAFAFEEAPDQPVGIGIPGVLAFLGLAFVACALIITGLPPLSGFVAKFGMLQALFSIGNSVPSLGLAVMMLVSGLAAILALMRFGVNVFWASGAVPGKLLLSEAVPVLLLLGACVLMVIQAGPLFALLERTSAGLHAPGHYIERVLAAPVIPGGLAAGMEAQP
jgi:multicomponent K+:H+ antiporter subunit D